MATVITQRELRNDNADIMRRVELGESFVVTRHGTPVADLVPHVARGARRYVPVEDVAAGFAALPPWTSADSARSWADERAELDALADDEDHDPWRDPAR